MTSEKQNLEQAGSEHSAESSTQTSKNAAQERRLMSKVVEKPQEEKVQSTSNIEPVTVVQKSSGKGLSVFAVLLSLVALAGSGFTWYQAKVLEVQKESRLTVGLTEIGAQVTRFGDAIARLQQDQAEVVSDAKLEIRLLRASTETTKAIRAIAEQQESVQESVLRLSSELERGVDKFVIEEVSQLLRLANNSVLFAEDIKSAVNALELADAQLKGLNDPSFGIVRAQINAELSALRALALPDIEAVSRQLSALKSQIKAMPLANEPSERASVVAEQTSADAPITWRTELVKIWRDLIGSISIQRVDQPPKPLLIPEQRYFLNENLALAVSKAELSLLNGQEGVFLQSLAEAEAWINDYFDLRDPLVLESIAQIDALQSTPIRVEIPDITGSYQTLQSRGGGQ